jgi:hypothetical protein
MSEWIKASKSNGGGNCVEIRRNGESIEVRDSKDRGGPILRLTVAEFDAFLDGARNAEFDHLNG